MAMTTARIELRDENSEENRVTRWRLRMLLRAGFDDEQARTLALRRDVDLHDAVGLVRHGCPPDVAFRILD
jgi:hypothetical protein